MEMKSAVTVGGFTFMKWSFAALSAMARVVRIAASLMRKDI
jgi:hypothetical protein